MPKPNTQIIVEIAQAHDGSLGILHSYIDAVARTGADAIKFQTHIAEAESSIHEPFRVKFSYEDDTRYDYWDRMGFTEEQWVGIKDHCEEVGLEFMSSPFSIEAVEMLDRIGMKRFKIASGEVSNFLMLEKIARTGKPILLSSGMSSYAELDETIAFLKTFGNPLSIFQCTTAYPTQAQEVGLNVIPEMLERYQIPVGLSDHSGEIFAPLAAVSLGASLLEFHAVFHKEMFGPDAKASLTFDQITELVRGVRFIDQSLNHPIDKGDNQKFQSLKAMFGKSLAVRQDLPEGHMLTREDLESKKPAGQGISTTEFEQVVGRKTQRPLKKFQFLTEEDLA
ncbi:MAG: N-acetylneuraminate synthase family protein [Bacteroidota bacterium]